MSQPGMAKHTESAFDESNAVRLLSDLLESKHTIKTFFKENDRTPNYDGTLELIGKEGDPRKQFIVQIKKTKAINCVQKGKNKGRYVYDMETSFLYYVKAKVAESPAIFFVVDVKNNRVFYLYLSDETLMSMGFEGKSTVRYAFGDNNIIHDIGEFTIELEKIAEERNTRFIYKSKDEIAAMQDAVEYLNALLDTDFKTIKEYLFPGLWRFGIGMSETDQFTISHYPHENKKEEIYRPEKTNMFCLYPQFKGSLNPNVSEFSSDSMFQYFDCIGNQTPMDYVKKNLAKYIRSFCQNPPIEILPTVVLNEVTYNKALKIHHYFDSDDELVVNKCIAEVNILIRYIDYLIYCEPTLYTELALRQRIRTTRGQISFFDSCLWSSVKDGLNKYYTEHAHEKQYNIHLDAVFKLLKIDCLSYYCTILELGNRNNEYVDKIWDYDPGVFLKERKYLEAEIKPICEKWFDNLPELYLNLYKKVFSENNKYKYLRSIRYCIEDNDGKYNYLTIVGKAHVYKSCDNELSINYTNSILDESSKLDKDDSLQYMLDGEIFAASIMNREPTLYYDGVRCFLYQGICDALDLKCEGIHINARTELLFR